MKANTSIVSVLYTLVYHVDGSSFCFYYQQTRVLSISINKEFLTLFYSCKVFHCMDDQHFGCFYVWLFLHNAITNNLYLCHIAHMGVSYEI